MPNSNVKWIKLWVPLISTKVLSILAECFEQGLLY